MDFINLINSEFFALVIIPILIFLARITDVSLGTIRVIFISRGVKLAAAFLGFIEVLIWLMAIKYVLGNLTNFVSYFAYAGGFASGTFVGIYIEEKISNGKAFLRIVTKDDASELTEKLKKAKYVVTSSRAKGINGSVKTIFTIIDRKNIKKVIEDIKKYNPKAFYSIEDVRIVSEDRKIKKPEKIKNLFGFYRKGK